MKRFSKLLAFVLAFAMVFSLNFIPASAANATSIKLRIDGYTSNITVAKGDKLAIFKLAQPLGSSTGGTVCKSSNTKVVQIVKSQTSDAQYIKAVGAGTAVVTATAKNGSGATGSITVKVADPAKKAASKMMTYKSSNPSVASVSDTGRVTGKNGGTATITITTKDGSKKTTSVKITVTASQALKERVMTAGDTASVSDFFKIKPSSRASRITYTSDNEGVLKVENGNFIAVSAGTAKVTLRDAAAEFEKTYTFTVNPKEVNVESISANNITDLHSGDTASIEAKVLPAGVDQNVTYKVADSSIASVTSKGVVTGKKRGTTNITITSVKDPSVSKTITVTVKEYLTRVTEWKKYGDTMEVVFGRFQWTTGDMQDFNDKMQNLIGEISKKLGNNAQYEMVRNGKKYTIDINSSGMTIKDQNGKAVDIEAFLNNGDASTAEVKVILPQKYIDTLLKYMEEGNTDQVLEFNGVAMSAVNFIGFNFKFGAMNKVTIVYTPTGETTSYEYFVSKGVLYFKGDVTKTPIMTERLANPASDKCIFSKLDVDWY